MTYDSVHLPSFFAILCLDRHSASNLTAVLLFNSSHSFLLPYHSPHSIQNVQIVRSDALTEYGSTCIRLENNDVNTPPITLYMNTINRVLRDIPTRFAITPFAIHSPDYPSNIPIVVMDTETFHVLSEIHTRTCLLPDTDTYDPIENRPEIRYIYQNLNDEPVAFIPPRSDPIPVEVSERPLDTFVAEALLREAIRTQMTCAISMESITPNGCSVTNCFHIFKTEELSEWERTHRECPICRSILVSRPVSI